MKNILVPVGASETATATLQYAIDLAKTFDAYVYVISVFKELSKVGNFTKVNAILREESETHLKTLIDAVDKKGVPVIAHPIKGDMLETITRFNKHVPVDLMVLAPQNNTIRDEVYLGKTTGKLLKQTNIPILIVPEDITFTPPQKILMAFKNGTFKQKKTLEPLQAIQNAFSTDIDVLHVETPDTTDEMLKVSSKLKSISHSYTQTQNATTYQAVLEHFQKFEPDMLCVVRRKRGFFKLLLEKNEIYKKEFYTSKPLLVLQVQEVD